MIIIQIREQEIIIRVILVVVGVLLQIVVMACKIKMKLELIVVESVVHVL